VTAPKLEDYPFDESLEGREDELVGLEKLRSIRDPRLRADLFALWKNLAPRHQAPLQQQGLFKPQTRPASRELVDREPKPGKDPRFP
jgi:hypothetical protein